MNKLSNRIAWLDNCKFFAITLVVLGHIIGFWNKDTTIMTRQVQDIIVSFNMPLFFVLAGFTCHASRHIDTFGRMCRYCLKQTKRLLVPAIVSGTVLYSIGLTSDILNCFWFLNILWRLILLLTISLFTVQLFTSRLWGGYLLFVVLSLLLGNRTSEFCWYLLFGIIAYRYKLLEKIRWMHLLLMFLVYAIILQITKVHNIYVDSFWSLFKNHSFILFLRIFAGMLASISVLSIFYKIIAQHSTISKMGTMTLGIYIIHSIIVICGHQVFHFEMIYKSPLLTWTMILLSTCVIIIVSVILISLLRKNRISSFLILGEWTN